jgi:2'-5' RNA ligase
MKQLKSHDFEEVYQWLGINLNTLGCVMLDLETLDISALNHDAGKGTFYYAQNKERFWIDGWVFDKTPHITLLYGFLETAKNYQPHIEKVLDGWELPEVEIENVGYFDSPYPDEPYYCIVAHIKVSEKLLEGHQRLQFLPHIDTFAGYKPHMTIAYISKNEGEKYRDDFVNDLNYKLRGEKLRVKKEINYGGNK